MEYEDWEAGSQAAEGTPQGYEGGDENYENAWKKESEKRQREDWTKDAGGPANSQETVPTTRDDDDMLSDLESEVVEHLCYMNNNPTEPANNVEGLKKQLKAARTYMEQMRKDHEKREGAIRQELTKLQQSFLIETANRITTQMGLKAIKDVVRTIVVKLDEPFMA